MGIGSAVGAQESVGGSVRQGVGEAAGPSGRLAVSLFEVFPRSAIGRTLEPVTLPAESEGLEGHCGFEAQPAVGAFRGHCGIEPVHEFDAIGKSVAVGVREIGVRAQSILDPIFQPVVVGIRNGRIRPKGPFFQIRQSVGVGIRQPLDGQ